MKKMIYMAAVAVFCGACTSSKIITQTYNAAVEIDAKPVIEAFLTQSENELDMKQNTSMRIHSFLYDSTGDVVADADIVSDTTASVVWELKEMPGEELYLVCVSFAESKENVTYTIEGKSNLGTLKIHQNPASAFDASCSPLGLAFQKIVFGNKDTVKVTMSPVSAQFNIAYTAMEEMTEPADTVVRFSLNAYLDLSFKDGMPSFSNASELTIPVSYGDLKTAYLLQSESLTYRATYDVGENLTKEFASDTVSIEAGEIYFAEIDWLEKSVMFEKGAYEIEDSEPSEKE